MKLNKKVLIVTGILAMATITTIASAQYDYDWTGSEAASAGFMGLSLLCCGIFLIPFMLSLRTVFTEKKASLYISTLGTVFGLAAAPFLSLLALLPPDILMEQHMIATRLFFLFCALTIVVYSIAILFNEVYEKIYAYIGIAVSIYIMVHLLVLLYNVVSQKFTVYIMIIWIIIQGFKLWKVLE